jgi:uncharacterized membrane protein YdfJ with MMPL/SSD domain
MIGKSKKVKGANATFWRRIVDVSAGRRSKWLVIAFWVALAVASVPLGSRLASVQENDAIAFLPGSAESTEVYELQERFAEGQDPPAVVAYVREGGMGSRAPTGIDGRWPTLPVSSDPDRRSLPRTARR